MNINEQISKELPELAKDLLQRVSGYEILDTSTLNRISREYAKSIGIEYRYAKDNVITMATKQILEIYANKK
ncbi:MAG: hypothetical protein PHC28_04930 [Flavobacterium sp.]|uniref:hypothetical protein n=1 Tax=Flavobacterium sp. TaxID=239 RepID=UPI002624F98D|nr:hypothetical protein [Flavobacterium sp.]MDD5149810.1 hypothetical protein [Flavobacterium sp.]